MIEVEVEVLRPLNHDLVNYDPGSIAFLFSNFAEALQEIGVVRIKAEAVATDTLPAEQVEVTPIVHDAGVEQTTRKTKKEKETL